MRIASEAARKGGSCGQASGSTTATKRSRKCSTPTRKQSRQPTLLRWLRRRNASSASALKKVDRFEADAVAEQVKATFGSSTSRYVGPQRKRDGRPNVKPGWPIDDYPQSQLVALAKWIMADESHLLTDDEVLTEMMRELRFQRRGAKIVAALEAEIKRAKSN